MDRQTYIMQLLENALETIRFAVLTTEHEGQPHASLVAITPTGGCRHLLFATYRDTRKYRNLIANNKVAVFIDGRDVAAPGLEGGMVATALGRAEEIGEIERVPAFNEHLRRHPDLDAFLRSADCALFRVTIGAYQVVRDIDDIEWCSVDDLAAMKDA